MLCLVTLAVPCEAVGRGLLASPAVLRQRLLSFNNLIICRWDPLAHVSAVSLTW